MTKVSDLELSTIPQPDEHCFLVAQDSIVLEVL